MVYSNERKLCLSGWLKKIARFHIILLLNCKSFCYYIKLLQKHLVNSQISVTYEAIKKAQYLVMYGEIILRSELRLM